MRSPPSTPSRDSTSPQRAGVNSENSQKNNSTETCASVEEKYLVTLNFIEEVLIEGQKITRNKINQLKDNFFSFAANQLKLVGRIEQLEKQNEELLEQVKQKSKPTYAKVTETTPYTDTKSIQIEKSKDKAKFTLFIKGKNGEKTKQLQREFTKAINPVTQKIKASLRSTENTLILETETQEDITKIMTNKTIEEKFLCEKPRKKRPLIILYSVDATLNEEEMSDTIYRQNFEETMSEDVFRKSFIPRFRTGPKDRAKTHHVIEVSPQLRRSILGKRRVYIGFNSIGVKDFLTVPKCGICQDYGHPQKYCRNEKSCSHCGAGHELNSCDKKAQPAICIPCAKRKRICNAKGTKECATYKMLLERTIAKTDYGDC